MNAIIGFTGIAMKNNPSDEVKNCLEKIDESSEYLLSLINDILDLTRIESGKVNYNPVPADVKNITDSALDITKGFLTNRDINFKIQREEAKIPKCTCRSCTPARCAGQYSEQCREIHSGWRDDYI